jgi:periplasmic protein TonB
MESLKNMDTNTHKPRAWAIAITVYSLLLAMLYFIKIVYEPVAEPIALGVDLNYGVDLVGSGDIQTLNKANPSKNKEEMEPSKSKAIEKPIKTKPQPVEKTKTPAPKISSKQPPVLTADEDTKVVVKKTAEVAKSSPKIAPTENKSTKPKVEAAPVPKPQPARTVDEGSLFKKSSGTKANSNGTVGTKSGIGGNNNGDGKAGEVGDKGDPRGTLDGKSLYGNPGKGGGSSGATVNISGWKNRGPLNIPKDNSSETGRIKFKVTVDDFGDIVKISVLESSVSPSITNYYKNQIIQKLKSNLIPDGNGKTTSSTGTITINITRA